MDGVAQRENGATCHALSRNVTPGGQKKMPL